MARNTDELIAERLGIRTRPDFSPLNTTIETTTTPILRPNPNRLVVIVYNTGVNRLHMAWRDAASAASGFVIDPQGFLSFQWDEDYQLMLRELAGIAIGASTTIDVTEIVIAESDLG